GGETAADLAGEGAAPLGDLEVAVEGAVRRAALRVFRGGRLGGSRRGHAGPHHRWSRNETLWRFLRTEVVRGKPFQYEHITAAPLSPRVDAACAPPAAAPRRLPAWRSGPPSTRHRSPWRAPWSPPSAAAPSSGPSSSSCGCPSTAGSTTTAAPGGCGPAWPAAGSASSASGTSAGATPRSSGRRPHGTQRRTVWRAARRAPTAPPRPPRPTDARPRTAPLRKP